jgi:hypothetical protein
MRERLEGYAPRRGRLPAVGKPWWGPCRGCGKRRQLVAKGAESNRGYCRECADRIVGSEGGSARDG